MLHKSRIFLILFAIFFNVIVAQKIKNKDSLNHASLVAKDAAKVEAYRIQVAAENLANMNTSGANYKSPPYRRKIVFIKAKGKNNRIVAVIKKDVKTKFKTIYDPNHIAANSAGYVKLPNVVEEIEKADIEEAKNRYEMNIEVFKISEAIKKKTINLLK